MSSLPGDKAHERMVAAFFARVKAADPERYKAVCDRIPVLSDRQMRSRLAAAEPLDRFPSLAADIEAKPIRHTKSRYSRRSREWKRPDENAA
jgi:hypothetical protein